MKEKILIAAIHFDDGIQHVHQPKNINTGIVVSGFRHHNCFAVLHALKFSEVLWKGESQGFLTNFHRFVDRYEAWNIAKAAGQIKEDSRRFIEGKLFSEDLY